MRRKQEIKLNVHYPTTEQGRKEFYAKLSKFYADEVRIKLHSCSLTKKQKLQILDELIIN